MLICWTTQHWPDHKFRCSPFQCSKNVIQTVDCPRYLPLGCKKWITNMMWLTRYKIYQNIPWNYKDQLVWCTVCSSPFNNHSVQIRITFSWNWLTILLRSFLRCRMEFISAVSLNYAVTMHICWYWIILIGLSYLAFLY